jgi:hypothetical protein
MSNITREQVRAEESPQGDLESDGQYKRRLDYAYQDRLGEEFRVNFKKEKLEYESAIAREDKLASQGDEAAIKSQRARRIKIHIRNRELHEQELEANRRFG